MTEQQNDTINLVQDQAANNDTTVDATTPPGVGAVPNETVGVDRNSEYERLERYLATYFPAEVDRTNLQSPESAVSVAIRLLEGYTSNAGVFSRETGGTCNEAYCNRVSGHHGQHGWVHYEKV